MKKIYLTCLAFLLLVPLAVHSSGAYFTDAKNSVVYFHGTAAGLFSWFQFSTAGARVIENASYASIECTGHNSSFHATIQINKANAGNVRPSFVLGQIANNSSFPLTVSVSFEGDWPSQGNSNSPPAGATYQLEPDGMDDLDVTFRINNGTPEGDYSGSLRITLSGPGLAEPVVLFLDCISITVH